MATMPEQTATATSPNLDHHNPTKNPLACPRGFTRNASSNEVAIDARIYRMATIQDVAFGAATLRALRGLQLRDRTEVRPCASSALSCQVVVQAPSEKSLHVGRSPHNQSATWFIKLNANVVWISGFVRAITDLLLERLDKC